MQPHGEDWAPVSQGTWDLTNVIPELPRETVNLKGAGTKDQGCNEETLKQDELGTRVEMVSGNNLRNINEKNKLPGNDQQGFVETSHLCPFHGVTRQVDKGKWER